MDLPIVFFHATPTTEIYTLSLHDALPISTGRCPIPLPHSPLRCSRRRRRNHHLRHLPRSASDRRDRKSTRLNSSHQIISYAVFCLKKKINNCTSSGHCLQLAMQLAFSAC